MTDTKPQPLTTLTDEQAASLISRLLSYDGHQWATTACYNDLRREAAEAFDAERAGRLVAEAERDRLREALRPLAVLKVPYKPQGNAGAYSIRFSDIERAQAALAGQEGGNG